MYLPVKPVKCVTQSFSALQRAENSSIARAAWMSALVDRFSALQRAENSSILALSSEIKTVTCFSALQRAENSSIRIPTANTPPRGRFQCSSASRKFLNFRYPKERTKTAYSFSALQRAENSSIPDCTSIQYSPARFQCSSASRKFLNRHCARFLRKNRSIVSVLFSEPKIPQSAAEAAYPVVLSYVSVLFSEPKIPQSVPVVTRRPCNEMFQCSSASRKFLNCSGCDPHAQVLFAFQCSSASRKFLNLD